MKRSLIRKIVGGLSLTSAMFVFQACYGTPQDFENDLLVEGIVKSEASGLPIKGIKVSVANSMQYVTTDDEGRFGLYSEMDEGLTLLFRDIDSSENGLYMDKDTVLNNVSENIFLNIVLNEK